MQNKHFTELYNEKRKEQSMNSSEKISNKK